MQPLKKIIYTSRTLDHLINYEHLMNTTQAEEIKQITNLTVFIVNKINDVYKKIDECNQKT